MKIVFTQAAQEWASNEVSLWNGVTQLAGVGPGDSATITVRWTLHPPGMVVDIK